MTTPANGVPAGEEQWDSPTPSRPTPGGWGPSTTPPSPGYGPPPAGTGTGYGQTYGAGSPPSGAPYGMPPQAGPYRPPAHQPGIIPLRPIGLGEILDGAFRAIRHNPRAMFGLSAVVVAVAGVVQAAITWVGLAWFSPDWFSADLSAEGDSSFGAVSGTVVPSVVSGVVFSVATTALIGLLIVAVSRSVLGTRMTLKEIWQYARPQIWRLFGVTILVSLLTNVVAALWVGGMVWAGIAEQYTVLVVVAIVGGILTLVWTVGLTVRTLLATPALMLEKLGVVESIRRSFQLTRGSFWRLLGIYALTTVIVGIVSQIVATPITLLSSVLLATTSESYGVLAASTALSTTLAALISTPFTAAVVALLYIDTRMRREGLDVQLVRAAQEQAA